MTPFISFDDNITYTKSGLRIDIDGKYYSPTKAATELGVTLNWINKMFLVNNVNDNLNMKFKGKDVSIKLVGKYESIEE